MLSKAANSLLPDGSTTHRVVDDALRLLRMAVAAASGEAIPLREAGRGKLKHKISFLKWRLLIDTKRLVAISLFSSGIALKSPLHPQQK
jgi:hypothetical protein